MNRRMDVDQRITAWLEAEAGPGGVGYLEETLVLLDRTPQRRWRGELRRALRLPAEWRPPVVPRAVVLAGIVALLVLALVVTALLVGSQRRLPPPFGLADNGLIAYDDGFNVYVANPDGTGQREVIGGLNFEWNAVFSPDGTRLAFWSSEHFGGPGSLFVAPADGSAPPVQLGAPSIMDDPDHVPPAWSPDSRHVAYVGIAPGDFRGLLVASVDGGSPRRLVATVGGGFPAWSPDGQWIAFRDDGGERTRLRIVRPDGTGLRELGSVPNVVNAYTQLGWSPQLQLVYHRPHERFGGQTVIIVYDLATSAETVVSDPAWYADAPTWSSDGTRISYHKEVSGPSDGVVRELVIVDPDGSNRRELGPVTDCLAHFSPDSKYVIAYTQGCFSTAEIVVLDVRDPGASPVALSLPGNIKGAPSWQRVDDGR